MTKTLEELKDKLYAAFDEALESKKAGSVSKADESHFLKAAGEIASAIVRIEERLDVRENDRRERQFDKGLKG